MEREGEGERGEGRGERGEGIGEWGEGRREWGEGRREWEEGRKGVRRGEKGVGRGESKEEEKGERGESLTELLVCCAGEVLTVGHHDSLPLSSSPCAIANLKAMN